MAIESLSTSPADDGRNESTLHLAAASMQVVCGTDFSPGALQAEEVAAALAHRLREPLVLLHAFDEPSRLLLPKELRDSLRAFEQQQLHEEVQRLQIDGLRIEEAFHDGAPSEVLAELGAQPETRLIVVSSGGHTGASRWILGSVAERVTHASTVPILVIRDPGPLIAWAEGKRKLRVFAATDLSAGSESALAWVRWLRHVGNCDITVAYIETASVAESALAEQSPAVAGPLLAKIERAEETCFRRRVRKLLATEQVRVLFEKEWGTSDAHLIQTAHQAQADLIVVGRNERHGLARLTHHSVSRAIVRYATTNVASIPASFASRSQ